MCPSFVLHYICPVVICVLRCSYLSLPTLVLHYTCSVPHLSCITPVRYFICPVLHLLFTPDLSCTTPVPCVPRSALHLSFLTFLTAVCLPHYTCPTLYLLSCTRSDSTLTHTSPASPPQSFDTHLFSSCLPSHLCPPYTPKTRLKFSLFK